MSAAQRSMDGARDFTAERYAIMAELNKKTAAGRPHGNALGHLADKGPPAMPPVMRTVTYTVSGRLDAASDLSSFDKVDKALPALLKSRSMASVPAIMWARVAEDPYQDFVSLGDEHTDKDTADKTNKNPVGSFPLTGDSLPLPYL